MFRHDLKPWPPLSDDKIAVCNRFVHEAFSKTKPDRSAQNWEISEATPEGGPPMEGAPKKAPLREASASPPQWRRSDRAVADGQFWRSPTAEVDAGTEGEQQLHGLVLAALGRSQQRRSAWEPAHSMHERLAEYGWKPHRDLLAQKNLSRASIYWYMR